MYRAYADCFRVLFSFIVPFLCLLRVSSDTIHPAVLLGTSEELEQSWSEWKGIGGSKHVNIKLHLLSGSSEVILSPQADVPPYKARLPAALSRGLAQLKHLRGSSCQICSWVTVAGDVAFLDHRTISCTLLSQGAHRAAPKPTQLYSTLRLGMGWGKSRGVTSLWGYSDFFSKFCLLHGWRQGLAVWEYWNLGSLSKWHLPLSWRPMHICSS